MPKAVSQEDEDAQHVICTRDLIKHITAYYMYIDILYLKRLQIKNQIKTLMYYQARHPGGRIICKEH